MPNQKKKQARKSNNLFNLIKSLWSIEEKLLRKHLHPAYSCLTNPQREALKLLQESYIQNLADFVALLQAENQIDPQQESVYRRKTNNLGPLNLPQLEQALLKAAEKGPVKNG